MLIGVIVVLGLSILIIAHEAGHFFVAKLFKLKVDEFGFGFPPRIFAWRPFNKAKGKRGETEYSLNWLPFGGFVKIAGENDQFDEGTTPSASDKKRFFYTQPAWKRSLIILAGILINFFAGWLLLSIILMLGSKPAIFVSDVLPNSLAAAHSLGNGAVLKGVSNINEFAAQLKSSNLFKMNFILSDGKETTLTALPNETSHHAILISDVQANSPAADAGLAKGDIIQGYTMAQLFIDFVNAHKGEKITLKVLRGETELILTPTVRANTSRGGLGVTLTEGELLPKSGLVLNEAGTPPQGFFASLGQGFIQSIFIARMTLVGFGTLMADLFTHGTLAQGIVGPIGIFVFANQAGQFGLSHVFYLIALISINLAVINLIPFPALDGGRFFLIILEKIRGARLSPKTEIILNTIGFGFLVFLMVLISVRDIINL